MKLEHLTEASGVEHHEEKIGDTTLGYHIDNNKHLIDLYSVRTPQTKRGQGSATQAMRAICDDADELGYDIVLIASPLDKKTRLDKLVNFYKKFGFELTGRAANPAGDPYMKRTPKAK